MARASTRGKAERVEAADTAAPARPGTGARFFSLLRAGEWWEYKIVPAVAIFYATALHSGTRLIDLALPFAQLLGALIVGAAFVGLINDLTDRDDDRRAGKPDRIGDRAARSWALVALTVAIGLAFLWSFAGRPFLFAVYLAGWLAFAAYSLPPLRLKGRAALGLACDALGAHVVPALLAVGLASAGELRLLDSWLLAVAVWSVAYGLRGILAHELADEPSDRAAGLDSFVVRYGSWHSRLLVSRLLFPLELVALTTILWLLGSPVVFLALAFSLLFLVAKIGRFLLTPVLVAPAPRQSILLADFYTLFFPVAVLIAAALAHRTDALVLLVHLLLFPRVALAAARDAAKLPREVLE